MYAQKFGVQRVSRKYNRKRSYIFFWLKRYDGSIESLQPKSRRPHSHPNQQIKLIYDMHRRNPAIGMVDYGADCRNAVKPDAWTLCSG